MLIVRQKEIMLVLVAIGFFALVPLIDRSQASQKPSELQTPVGILKGAQPEAIGSVVGDLERLSSKDAGNRASILAHPPPRIFLVFKHQSVNRAAAPKSVEFTRVALPDKAIRGLGSMWRAFLAYSYKSKVEGIVDAKTQISEDRKILTATLMTERWLQGLEVNAPDGPRRFSEKEAEAVVSFLRTSAGQIIEQSREYRNQRAIISSSRGNGS